MLMERREKPVAWRSADCPKTISNFTYETLTQTYKKNILTYYLDLFIICETLETVLICITYIKQLLYIIL